MENNTQVIGKRNIIRIVLGTALILLIPLIAMQFTDEVDWKLFDFVIIGILLLGTGFTYELLASKMKAPAQRAMLALVLVTLLFLIWAELAVGIFGSPFAGS
ncbi:MAG: hypothetical protein WD467_03360 [Candidatus Saccharimonadales bacterium]